MGRLILAVLLAMILAISRVSNNPTPQCLPVIVYHLCSTPSLLPSRREQGGEGRKDTESTKGRAKPLSCRKLTVTEVRC